MGGASPESAGAAAWSRRRRGVRRDGPALTRCACRPTLAPAPFQSEAVMRCAA